MKHAPIHSSRVKFAASPQLQAVYQPFKFNTPTFQNPFSEQLEAQSRRTSASSQDSYLELTMPFANHRDTLARLLCNSQDPDPEDEDNDSYEDTPTQYSLLAPVRTGHLLCQHRDTLARLHFRQNYNKALPEGVFEVIVGLLSEEDYKNMRLTCRRWADHLPRPSHVSTEILTKT